MEKILDFSEVESATYRVSCSKKRGTAFFVNNDAGELLLLTSAHTISDSESSPVNVEILGVSYSAEVVEKIQERDVAVLRLTELPVTILSLPLSINKVAQNIPWQTYGYPIERITSGGRYTGTVSRTNNETAWDIDLECDQYGNLEEFDGLSGAPLVVDGQVLGIIGYELSGTLGATSIDSIAEHLRIHKITLLEIKIGGIPDSIEEDIANTTPNLPVLEAIHKVIETNPTGNYYLVTGSPGSGKTTIAAQLEFNEPLSALCDKYFVKVPESDSIPTHIRATPEFFMNWMEQVYSRILYNKPAPKSDESVNKRLLTIHKGILALALHFSEQGKIAFIVIDGIDDVPKGVMDSFFAVLPNNIPDNLKFILSCTSKNILPINIQTLIPNSHEIKVTPLSIQTAEKYLNEHLKDRNLSHNQITELANKSEGHPLYLRYLTKYVLNVGTESVDEWIHSIPTISGEIERYYRNIWNKIEDSSNEVWLAGTLSRIRQAINKKTLLNLIPEVQKQSFNIAFNKIQHLLKDDDNKISVYHSSFSDFVNRQTEANDSNIHDSIAQYCISGTENFFTISEKIYHLSNGSAENNRKALDECNQIWVDKCAVYSVNPDIVLTDIRKIIGIAAELGISFKVIGLILLSQRVNFRYNTLFNENATFLVSALLALGKANEALRYVLRNNVLMVSDDDALFLLQLFYEYGALKEADELFIAIDRTAKRLLENENNSDTLTRFINLKFNSVTLSANSDFKAAMKEFLYFKKTVVEYLRENGNNEEVIHKIKDGIGSYQGGYFIWRFSIPPITKISEENGMPMDDTSSGFIAMCIIQALEFQRVSPKTKTKDVIADWISDLESVIDRYGVNNHYSHQILFALIGRSKRVDVIEGLVKGTFPQKVKLNIRKPNGVDIDVESLSKFTLFAECTGFLDSSNSFPKLSEFGYSNWEPQLTNLIEYLYFLSGKIKRIVIDNKDETEKLEEDALVRLKLLLEKLVPELHERIHWDRSYSIPEVVFPSIYSKLINLLIEFYPQQLTDFIELIEKGKSYQLGLYTEGYINSLFEIITELAKNNSLFKEAFKIAKVLEKHILTTVENRWERNEYLLRLVEIYAKIQSSDKAKEVFDEMIKTSMGPSWYKEAQLGIINSAVTYLLPQNKDLFYLQRFAADLDHASGEMTFQRYVKQHQEEFVGNLAGAGFLEKSIDYFKYLVFPNYGTIINNAEAGLVDMPLTGSGYVLGARNIEEQAGILDLVSNIDCGSSHVIWGLVELLIPGDDRYLAGFAKIHAQILNQTEVNDKAKLDILYQRLARFVITEVDPEFRGEYLREIVRKLSDSNYEALKSIFQKVGFETSKGTEDNTERHDRQRRSDDPFEKLLEVKEQVKLLLEVENRTDARKLIVKALSEVQDKYGIWSSNYSEKINDLRDLLSDTYLQSSELIKDLKNLLLNEPYYEEWVIADKLIAILKNIDNEDEKHSILSVISEHINLMVRTPQALIDNYNWITDLGDKTKTNDEILLELLIWFLNHPSISYKNRAAEIISWIGQHNPDIVLPIIIKELMSNGYQISKELSSSILHQISVLNPVEFWAEFKKCLEFNSEELLSINHFMIRSSILASLSVVEDHGIKGAAEWIEKFKLRYPDQRIGNGEVELDEAFFEKIDSELYDLYDLEILDENFRDSFISLINKYAPLNIDECIKANHYIERSFNDYNDIKLISDFECILRYALNEALLPYVPWEDNEKVNSILRIYQPTFPETVVIPHLNNMDDIKDEIIDLFKGKISKLSELFKKELFFLHYSYKNYFASTKNPESVELTAYLIPIDKFVGDSFSYPTPEFSENNYPYSAQNEYDYENVIPLVVKSHKMSGIIGSDLVPSKPVLNINRYLSPEAVSKISLNYWRTGRNWEQSQFGIPKKSGFYLSVSKESINDLKANYKVVIQLYHNFKFIYLDYFEQKIFKK